MRNLYRFNEDSLVFEPVSHPLIWRTLFFISCLFLFNFVVVKEVEYIQMEAIVLDKEVKEETVFEMVDRLPFKYPDIIKAQILIETGHFKDEVYLHNNNLFGMRLPNQRLTLATGSNLKHATFNTVEESLLDRLIYEAKYLNKLDKEQYFSFLDRLYAEGDGYSSKLKQIIKNNKL